MFNTFYKKLKNKNTDKPFYKNWEIASGEKQHLSHQLRLKFYFMNVFKWTTFSSNESFTTKSNSNSRLTFIEKGLESVDGWGSWWFPRRVPFLIGPCGTFSFLAAVGDEAFSVVTTSFVPQPIVLGGIVPMTIGNSISTAWQRPSASNWI